MSPKNRRKQQAPTSEGKRIPRVIAAFFAIATVAVIGIYLYISSAFKNTDSVRIAVSGPQSDVKILIFDLATPSATVLTIPAQTQVSVARQLGEWRIGSVWELGEDEGDKGGILADTVMKSFGIPTEEWGGEGVMGYVSPNILKRIRSALGIYDSSLGLRERLALGLVSLRIRSGGVANLHMEDYAILREEELKDGEAGYVVRGGLPSRLVGLFADEHFITEDGKPLKIRLVDATDTQGFDTIKTIQKVTEVLGAKVVAIVDSEQYSESGCLLSANQDYSKAVSVLSRLFGCGLESGSTNDVDLEIRFGSSYLRKF